jgi:HAD superfamily hydrolase (TIGR01490 family)
MTKTHSRNILAIFDFDGTITTRDSFADFIFFSHGAWKTIRGVIVNSPILILYLLKFVPNWQAKEEVFSYFFKGMRIEAFDQLANRHAAERLPKILRPLALEKLKWHKEERHTIVVVSASFENYLRVWCDHHGVLLLATQVEVENGVLTGRFSSKNCFGDEKVRRIKEKYELKDYEFIYAYGDSRGDLPLKEIADQFFYKPFLK